MMLGYIDPGTGGIILQIIVAGIAGGAFYFRKALSRIFHIGRKQKQEDALADDE
jgi:hypothetical protein